MGLLIPWARKTEHFRALRHTRWNQNPHQIRTYMINSISGIDVLRVIYKRPEGSFLPNTSSYEFPRVQRTIENSRGVEESVLETSPALRAAEAELKTLIKSRG